MNERQNRQSKVERSKLRHVQMSSSNEAKR